MVSVFSLLKSKRKPAEPVEPVPLDLQDDPDPSEEFRALTFADEFDDLEEGLPGVPDLYAILGVDPRASDDIIRFAYRRKAARLHERRWRPGQAARQLAELNAAYEILGNADRRADYDRRRLRQVALERVANGTNGRALPSGQRHQGRRVRIGRPGGVVEVVVIVAVIALAAYAALAILNTRSLVDFSWVLDLGENLGVSTRRRPSAAPTPTVVVPTAVPTPRGVLLEPAATSVPQATQPAPRPTEPPPAQAAAKPPAAPAPPGAGSRFNGSTAQVNNPTPPRRTQITVVARVVRDGGPVAGAQVHAIAHFKTVDERWPAGDATQATNQDGQAAISFNIGDATPGYPVNIDVIAQFDGEQVLLQTSFTPR